MADRVTWESKLRELLPHAPISELTYDYCPSNIFGEQAPGRHFSDCIKDCDLCWNKEYKEEAE